MDCNLNFKSDTLNLLECMEKSWLHGTRTLIDYKTPFESHSISEIKEFVKNIIRDQMDTERNFNNPCETAIWYQILFHMIHLEAINHSGKVYCGITLG